MRHARADYMRFQDPEHKIPEDEPVFLLRAKDMYAAPVVAIYAMSILQDPFAPPEAVAVAKRAKAWAEEMRAYGEAHGVKRPNMPEEA